MIVKSIEIAVWGAHGKIRRDGAGDCEHFHRHTSSLRLWRVSMVTSTGHRCGRWTSYVTGHNGAAVDLGRYWTVSNRPEYFTGLYERRARRYWQVLDDYIDPVSSMCSASEIHVSLNTAEAQPYEGSSRPNPPKDGQVRDLSQKPKVTPEPAGTMIDKTRGRRWLVALTLCKS